MNDSPQERRNIFLVGDAEINAPTLEGGLYVTATPIGNLGDVTLRALETLAAADLIACEDTRITSRLTQRYGIDTPLIAYHEHNAARQRPRLLAALAEGKAVALVSDAGTPLVSDPGYRLVTEAIDAGHRIIPIPGASATLAGLVGAGLPSDAFLFAGFLPAKSAARRKRLGELAQIPATLIFYEGPQRVSDCLADMAAVLGDQRRAVVARELTKKFETFRREDLATLAAQFASEAAPKGEVTILIAPPDETAPSDQAIDAALRERLTEMSPARAAAEVAAATGARKNDVYRRAIALKDEGDG